MSIWQKNSKKRILKCVSVIGALILVSALIFVGCEEPAPSTPADTTPPAQPATISNVRVASGAITFDVANPNGEMVNVTVAVTPEPPAGARIVVGSEAGKTIAETVIAVAANGETANIQITNLVDGTAYTVTLTTADSKGNKQSQTVSSDPKRPVPTAPTNLTAAAGNGEVVLNWTASAGGAVSQYHIYRATGTDISSATRLTPTNPLMIDMPPYTDESAENGTEYTYAVRAVSANGTESANSNTGTVTPLAPTGVPNSLMAAAAAGSVTLTWTPPATMVAGSTVNGYRIYRATGSDNLALLSTSPATLTAATRTYTDSTVTNGTEYRYVVRTVNQSSVESGDSETAMATPLATPGVPTGLNATPGDGQVSLNWSAPTPVVGGPVHEYFIYRVAGTDFSSPNRLTPTDPVTIKTTSYIDLTAVNGTEYTYAVRAVNANGVQSENSNTDATTPHAAPNAPTNLLVASVGEDSVTLTWTAPVGGGEVDEYHIYRTGGGAAAQRITTLPSTTNPLTYTDSGLTEGTEYTYEVRSINANDVESASNPDISATPRVATSGFTARDGGAQVVLSWDETAGATEYYILRTVGAGREGRLTTAPPTIDTTSYTDRDVILGTTYRYRIQAVFGSTAGAISAQQSVTLSIDRDNDTLIDIENLDILNNIRHNLSGTDYKTSAGAAAGIQCGTAADTACTGYELTRDLDFAVAGDYASGSINNDWRPRAGSSDVAPSSATNGGWVPIGTNSAPFGTTFEGNGFTISNLYSRNATNAADSRFGLFGQLGGTGSIRNFAIEDSNVYGGSARDHVGIAVGVNFGTIANVAVVGGSAHGGNGNDEVGGLAGYSSATIIASSSSAAAHGNEGGNDNVGSLVGNADGTGTITASYATGSVDGGTGNDDHVGGLAGRNTGTIRASYARGNVNANDGDNEAAGGLVGLHNGSPTIIASYAAGNVDGGAGGNDTIGQLTGNNHGTITASYGFGVLSGGEADGNDGDTLPAGAGGTIGGMTAPGTTSPANSAAPAEWNQASSSTMGAWDFGTSSQLPVLRYADYDGSGGTDYCDSFSNIPGTSTAITCDTTLLSEQGTLRTIPVFDLTVSATSGVSTTFASSSITLDATVRNRPLAPSSSMTTLTYYRSTDNMIDNGDTALTETDMIPAIAGGAEDTQDIDITVPAAVGTYYYYACVPAQTNEADTTNNCSSPIAIVVTPSIDMDSDMLIDIGHLDALNNIRYNLSGTSYKTSAGDAGLRCGTAATPVDCAGYELTGDLDFAVAGDYADGTINMAWQPTAGGTIVAPGSATNSGWEPLGSNSTPFNARFEGNGYTISNLYMRNSANTNDSRFGFFGQLSGTASIRNFVIEDGTVYGGSARDHVGIAVGVNSGTIINVAIRGGSVHGGDGNDEVGGLAAYSSNTIFASSSTADAYGDEGGNDNVGSLVGNADGGTITASYASGAVDGGTGNDDHVGGLAGRNAGTIRASYARGNVNANDGDNEAVGGLVGLLQGNPTIIASYATGDVDGGEGGNDNVGRLTGNTAGTITASYAVGTISGRETGGNNGSTLPAGAGTLGLLTIPVDTSPPNTAAPAAWNQASSSTMSAWDFGTPAQYPALRYADYDGSGSGTDYCASFTNVPGASPSTAIACGTTLLSGQDTLRSLPAVDLTVSATSTSNMVLASVSITINATVRNRPLARSSTATTLTYYRSTDNMIDNGDTALTPTDSIPALAGGAEDTQDIMTTVPAVTGSYYYYACVPAQANEADRTNNCSDLVAIDVIPAVDTDNDNLIEIRNLTMLNNIRFNLSGTDYKTSAGAAGLQCGTGGTTACIGYELMRDFDFAEASDYFGGSINNDWRPTGGTPDSATNSGWVPIGTGDAAPFAAVFEGNGFTISNLYSRNTANTNNSRVGLFGQLNSSATLRNLLIEDSNVYGGSARDHIGVAVGINYGTISNVAVRGGSVYGDNGTDEVGGLAGWSNGTIIASSSTAAVYGDEGGRDNVGGLVGQVNGGSVTASYATGTVGGGTGNDNHVGGLVGENRGTIRASYARGNADGDSGTGDVVGGLVGRNYSTVIASYATGNADGGAGGNDHVGSLSGFSSGTITDSYSVGLTSGREVTGHNGSTLPTGADTLIELTAPGTTSPPNTAVPAVWNQASSHTLNAWNFGTATQYPVLRYADYDGSSGTDYCTSFTNRTAITCGTTLLPGQDTLRALASFDFTVSATPSSNPVLVSSMVTLSATVRTPRLARSAPTTTLTYYSSTDDTISTATDTSIGTDTIPALNSGAMDTQDISITLPGTVGVYYYYACVTTQPNEADADNNCSSVISLEAIGTIDADNDMLVDIQNLDMFNNIRFNLSGNSYKPNAGSTGIQCGTNATVACIGYELMRDLDFAVAGDYADGTINMAWRPTSAGRVVAAGSATNSGWEPIGSNPSSFNARFEGNGNTISNLYIRNSANTGDSRFGLFGQLGGSASIRNFAIEDGNAYGGSARDHVGMVVGVNAGTIANVAVIGGSVHGGGGNDEVGGLAGYSSGTIVASSSSAAVHTGGGTDNNAGGLVGQAASGGNIIASYATGAVAGGSLNRTDVGGLAGNNGGTIRASYSTGNAITGGGGQDRAGGLVGQGGGTIIASYSSGNADAGPGINDVAGRLVGSGATITASYAFGTAGGGEAAGSDGTTLPSGVTTVNQLSAPGSDATTAVGVEWNQAASRTMDAWDLGSATQNPVLRYADYDGTGGTDYCALFSNVPGTKAAITCGMTVLPGQVR